MAWSWCRSRIGSIKNTCSRIVQFLVQIGNVRCDGYTRLCSVKRGPLFHSFLYLHRLEPGCSISEGYKEQPRCILNLVTSASWSSVKLFTKAMIFGRPMRYKRRLLGKSLHICTTNADCCVIVVVQRYGSSVFIIQTILWWGSRIFTSTPHQHYHTTKKKKSLPSTVSSHYNIPWYNILPL